MAENLYNGVHHICMKVKDIQSCVDFYTKELGYKLRVQWDGGALLRGPEGVHLEFFPEDSQSGYAHVAYNCSNVDGAFRSAVALGCEAMNEPADAALPATPPIKIRFAFIKDPQGNIIELFHEYGG
jgi:catechol 2,3-dioxygenase-like lactoylglutathione lyase family enzyme